MNDSPRERVGFQFGNTTVEIDICEDVAVVIENPDSDVLSNDESLVDILAGINSSDVAEDSLHHQVLSANDESLIDILADANSSPVASYPLDHHSNLSSADGPLFASLNESSHSDGNILSISTDEVSLRSKEDVRESLLAEFTTPPYEPILLCDDSSAIPESFISLCKKGPKFIPTPQNVDWLDIQRDFDNFSNRVRYLANDFDPEADPSQANNILPPYNGPPVKRNFSRQAKSTIPAVEAFLNAVQRDIFSNTKRIYAKDNLPRDERDALKWWQDQVLHDPDSDLCIRMQDKGSRFVIVDKPQDIEKAEAQISRSSFRKVDHDLTNTHINKVESWATKWRDKNAISKSWFEFIVNNKATPGKNSTMYKTHKPNIPVRLLTTGCNTAIENLCRFVEKHTYPLAESLPSRIKDTAHLLEIIDEINTSPLPENVHILSFDIVNMFPSISNAKGIMSVRRALNKRKNKSPSTQCIIEALEISLSCNNSVFNHQHLLQTDGTAMGAPNSCSYADLATAEIDEKVQQSQRRRFSELTLYKKYRDDVIALWCGDTKKIDEFFMFLNSIDRHLQFTIEIGVFFKVTTDFSPLQLFSFVHIDITRSNNDNLISRVFEILPGGILTMWTSTISEIDNFLNSLNSVNTSMQFAVEIGKHKLKTLDLEISLKDGYLQHTVYRKPTNSQMYLDYSSCHPKGSKDGIVKGVALRLRRLCSTTDEYMLQAKSFMASLAARGHDPHNIHREFHKILHTSRADTRIKRPKSNKMGTAMFITKYNPRGPRINTIVTKYMNSILHTDPTAKHIFPTIPMIYKRCTNLSESILRADPYNIPVKSDVSQSGTQHCGKKCDLCNNLVHSNTFKSQATGRVFFIRASLTCITPNVIYLLSCKRCLKQGVGSTGDIKKRWGNYKSHTNKSKDTCSITKHFNRICRCIDNPPSLMSIQLIDFLNNTNSLTPAEQDDLLLQKEKFWIGTLISMHKGLNSSHDWNRKKRIGGEDFSK
jgi:hypothetical protein